jgi:hypothetical protein
LNLQYLNGDTWVDLGMTQVQMSYSAIEN